MATRRPRRQTFTTAIRNLGFNDVNSSSSDELSSSSTDRDDENTTAQSSNHDWHFTTTSKNDHRPTLLPELTVRTGVNPLCPESPDDNLLKRKTLLMCIVRPTPSEILPVTACANQITCLCKAQQHIVCNDKLMNDQKLLGKRQFIFSILLQSQKIEIYAKIERKQNLYKPNFLLRYNANIVQVWTCWMSHYIAMMSTGNHMVRVCKILHLIHHIMHGNFWAVQRHFGGSRLHDRKNPTLDMSRRNQKTSTHGGRPRSVITADAVQRNFNEITQRDPSKVLPREGNARPSNRYRVFYSQKNVRKQTLYQCLTCDGEPGLCETPCFNIFHRK